MSVDESTRMTEHVAGLWCTKQGLLLRKPLVCFVQKLHAAAAGGSAALLPCWSQMLCLDPFPNALGFGSSEASA